MHAAAPVWQAPRVCAATFARGPLPEVPGAARSPLPEVPGASASPLPKLPGASPSPLRVALVIRGRLHAQARGEAAVHAGPGELAIFTQGGGSLHVEPPSDLVWCDMHCDAWLARTLFASLPRALVRPLATLPAGSWIEASLLHGARRAQAQCAPDAAVRLAEALLPEILQACLPQAPGAGCAWMAGAGDRIVGAALAAMHERPAQPWTLAALAREANTSRSVLVERFQQLVGCPPMHYLAQWRLGLAERLLAGGGLPLVHVAQQVGYQTDTAFSRAFRRLHGIPPAAWRRRVSGRAADARAGLAACEAGQPVGVRSAMASSLTTARGAP